MRHKRSFPSASMGDIAFLLLLFFLILAITTHTSPADIKQAQSPSWAELQEEYPDVYLTKDGRLFLGDTPVELSSLSFVGNECCLIADRDTPFSKIEPVLSHLKESGTTTIHCMVEGAQ